MAQVKLEWDAHRQGETVVRYDIYRRVLSASQAAPRRRRFWSHMVFGGWRKVDEVPGDHQVYTDDGRMLFRKWLRPTYKHNTEINPLYNYEYRIVAVDQRGNRSPPSHCRVYSTGAPQRAGGQVDGTSTDAGTNQEVAAEDEHAEEETRESEGKTKEPSFSYGTVDVSTPRGVYDKYHKYIALGWELEGNPNDLLRYDVERRQINGEGVEADWDNKPAVAQLPHKDEDIEPNKIYQYRVRAVDKSGVGGDWKETEPIPTAVETSEEEPEKQRPADEQPDTAETTEEAPKEPKPSPQDQKEETKEPRQPEPIARPAALPKVTLTTKENLEQFDCFKEDSLQTFIYKIWCKPDKYDKLFKEMIDMFDRLHKAHKEFLDVGVLNQRTDHDKSLQITFAKLHSAYNRLPYFPLSKCKLYIQSIMNEAGLWAGTDDDMKNLEQNPKFVRNFKLFEQRIDDLCRRALREMAESLQDYNKQLIELRNWAKSNA